MKPQPFDTAPTEKYARILAWYPLAADFDPKNKRPFIQAGWYAAMHFGDGYWETGLNEIDLRTNYYGPPTHWMPMPEAPARIEVEPDNPSPLRRPGNAQSI